MSKLGSRDKLVKDRKMEQNRLKLKMKRNFKKKYKINMNHKK